MKTKKGESKMGPNESMLLREFGMRIPNYPGDKETFATSLINARREARAELVVQFNLDPKVKFRTINSVESSEEVDRRNEVVDRLRREQAARTA